MILFFFLLFLFFLEWNLGGKKMMVFFSGGGFITAIEAQVESEWFLFIFLWNICAYIDHLYIYP